MRSTHVTLLASLSMVLGGMACQKDDKSMEAALKRIDSRLKNIEAKLEKGVPAAAAGRAGARGRGQRPPGPDPQAVYSVDIKGAAFKGPEHAKITVVEAFEFA